MASISVNKLDRHIVYLYMGQVPELKLMMMMIDY